MIKTKLVPRTIEEVEYIQCDVCKTSYSVDDCSYEQNEFINIDYIGGYGSVFGDGTRITLDICQHCFKVFLGDYIQ
jgi:hypothetical protein